MYLSLESQSHNGVKYDGLVCTSHFLIAAIIGQILSLTWGKSSLPMVRNLTGEITNRKLSKLKMSNLAKFPLSCQTTVISKYPFSTTSQNILNRDLEMLATFYLETLKLETNSKTVLGSKIQVSIRVREVVR